MLKVNMPGRIRFNQIGVVVKDLDKAINYYSTRFGVGPFRTINLPNWEIVFRGKPKTIEARFALTDYNTFNDIQLELIEVPKEESIYSEFFRRCGEGVHHLGFGVEDFEETVSEWETQGFKVIQRSKPRDSGGWSYMDTDRVAGVILELRKHNGMPPV